MSTKEITYETIDRPYDYMLQRSDQVTAFDQVPDDSPASNTAPQTSGSSGSSSTASGEATSNGSTETKPVKSDGGMGDIWIDNFIRSLNWKPKKAGFYIDGQTGYAEFMNVFVSGNIQASTGTIGGFDIGPTTISSTGLVLTSGSSASLAFGNPPPTSSSSGTGIYIDKTGLFGLESGAQNFIISTTDGSITAIKGTIGGSMITSTAISSSNFISGLLGSGWRITNSGNAEFENITARGIIRTSVFEKGTISSVGGYLLVAPSDVLGADMTALDASTLTTKSVTFPNNSVLRIKDGTDDEYLLVVSSVGFVHTVTRDLAGAYTSNNNPIWKTGTAVVSLGVGTGTKTGFIMMDTASSNSPFMDIVARNSNTYNDYTTKVRIGNLAGITDANVGLPIAGQNYGIYTNNGYFSGTIVALTGTIGGFTIGATTISAPGLIFSSATSPSTPYIEVGDPNGARVDIQGNDIFLFDDTTGGGGTITGDSASIQFLRTDGEPGLLEMVKRAGKDNDLDNYFEMFYTIPSTNAHNVMLFGMDSTSGTGSIHTGEVVFAINRVSTESLAPNNGFFFVSSYEDGVYEGDNIVAGDARAYGLSSGSFGVVLGSNGGLGGIGYNESVGLYMRSLSKIEFGINLVPNEDNSIDIGSASFRVRDIYLGGTIHGNSGNTISSTAGENLTAGQPVGYSNNLTDTVARALRTGDYSNGITSAPNYTYDFWVIPIADDKFACAYARGDTGGVTTFVASINRSTMVITQGSQISVAGTGYLGMAKLDTNKYMIFSYDNGGNQVYQTPYSVSGTTVTDQGSSHISGAAVNGGSATQIGTDKVLVSYSSSSFPTGNSVVCITYSTYTATWGTPVSTGLSTSHNMVVQKIATDKFVLFDTTVAGNVFTAIIGTISGTVITLGSNQSVGSSITNDSYYISPTNISTNLFMIRAYKSSSSSVLILCSVSSTTITTRQQTNTDTNAGSIYSDGTFVYEASNVGTQTTNVIYKVTISGGTSFTKTTISYGIDLGDASIPPKIRWDTTGSYLYVVSTKNVLTQKLFVYVQGMSNNFIGIAQNTVSKDAAITVLIKGLDANQSGLLPGNIYKITDSGLTLTGDTTLRNSVVAKSSTSVLI